MTQKTEIEPVARRRVTVQVEMQRFRIPPVESALVIGRRAPIGPTAMQKALQEMVPQEFVRVDVEHPTIQTIMVHAGHLKRIPQDRLVSLLLSHAESIVDETEMLHVSLDVRVTVSEEFDL